MKTLHTKLVKKGILAIVCCLVLSVTHAQTVDDVIAKYIAALGGETRLKALRSLSIIGVMQIQGLEMDIKSAIVNKIGVRTEVVIPGVGTMYQIITTNKGWSYMPSGDSQKPVPLSAGQISAGQPTFDLQGALLNYRQKGHKAELLGTEMADSLNCYKIKLTYKTGDVAYYFIDVKNYYRVKLITTEIVNGVPGERATTYSDFRRTPEGYLVPYRSINSSAATKVTKVTINPPIKPSIFTVTQ